MNSDFNYTEFGTIRNNAGSNNFVLSNIESMNSVSIRQGLSQSNRLVELDKVTINQMSSLIMSNKLKKVK